MLLDRKENHLCGAAASLKSSRKVFVAETSFVFEQLRNILHFFTLDIQLYKGNVLGLRFAYITALRYVCHVFVEYR